MAGGFDLSATRIALPGTALAMGVTAESELDLAITLGDTPVVIAFGPAGLRIWFDADVLRSAYGDAMWNGVEAILEQARPETMRGPIQNPLRDAIEALAAAEARLLEGDDQIARAVLLLVALQARIGALIEGVPLNDDDDPMKRRSL